MKRHLIRPPLWARVYVVAFGIVWLAALGWAARRAHGASLAIAIGMALVGALIVWRVFRLGVDAEGDRLLVRNNVRTLTLTRDEVQDLRSGTPPNMPIGGRCIFAVTADGGLTSLDVTIRPTLLPASRRRLERPRHPAQLAVHRRLGRPVCRPGDRPGRSSPVGAVIHR